MLDKYLDFNSFSEQFSIEDWNEVVRNLFFNYFEDEDLFEKHKELLRTEIVNYIPLIQNPIYLKLFETTFDIFEELATKSHSTIENVFLEHFDNVVATDDYWTRSCLSQPDLKELQAHDIINVKFKAIEDILEGCFKSRFILFYHVNCILQNLPFSDKDFGQYITDFKTPNKIFDLYLFDPIYKIKTSQWRNIASHKTYKIQKNNIQITYGKGKIKQVNLSYKEFEEIFNWIKLIYGALRLAEVITVLGKRYILEKVNEKAQGINLRLEARILQIVHNMQIVGFPFVKIQEENDTLCLLLNKKNEGDIKDSVIHASQCLDQLAIGIIEDEFNSDKYKFAKVKIIAADCTELGSAWVNVNDLFEDGNKKNLIDCVRFKIGDAVF